MDLRETTALEMISKGYPRADVCVAIGCNDGELTRLMKSIPKSVGKSLRKMQGASEVGKLMSLFNPGNEQELKRVCLAMGKTREQLLADIDSGRAWGDNYGG